MQLRTITRGSLVMHDLEQGLKGMLSLQAAILPRCFTASGLKTAGGSQACKSGAGCNAELC